MKSLLLTAALAALALTLLGCRDRQPEPVPGPQSSATQHGVHGESCPQQRLFSF
jgi:hypothetical protein